MQDKTNDQVSSISADIFFRDKDVSDRSSYCKVSGYGVAVEVGRTTSYSRDDNTDTRNDRTNSRKR